MAPTATQTSNPAPALPHPGFSFNLDEFAPVDSTWRPPSWLRPDGQKAYPTGGLPTKNGLGEDWDYKNPKYRGIDLTKVDPRIKIKHYEIEGTDPNSTILFEDVNIIDSTGREPYHGDVLVRGQRIVSVGPKISEAEAQGARVVHGQGRYLMSGLTDAHTHFTWTNAGSLDSLATMPVEEHTLFSMRSARTFLDCGYTMCVGAASAKERIDTCLRNAINANDIPGPRYLA